MEIVTPTGTSNAHEADPVQVAAVTDRERGVKAYACRVCGGRVWRDDAGAWEHVEASR